MIDSFNFESDPEKLYEIGGFSIAAGYSPLYIYFQNKKGEYDDFIHLEIDDPEPDQFVQYINLRRHLN